MHYPYFVPIIALLGGYLSGPLIQWVLVKILPYPPKRNPARSNLGALDRFIRCLITFGLFIWAMLENWDPLLLYLTGFVAFEALSSWCVIFAICKKNTHPYDN